VLKEVRYVKDIAKMRTVNEDTFQNYEKATVLRDMTGR
jgi:hypothetical protein